MNAVDRTNYASTSMEKQHRNRAFSKREYRLYRILDRFFDEKEFKDFRELQKRLQLIISGSVALQFFERKTFPDSDLDLYALDSDALEVGKWLMSIGYTFIRQPSDSTDPIIAMEETLANPTLAVAYNNPGSITGFSCVFRFVNVAKNREIQLIVTWQHPVDVVIRFHSSEYLHAHLTFHVVFNDIIRR